MRSFSGSARVEESDAVSVPQEREKKNLFGKQIQSCGFSCTARNLPPESALRSIWTGVLQVQLKGLGSGRRTSSREEERVQ